MQNVLDRKIIPRDSYTGVCLYNFMPGQVDQSTRVTIVGPIPKQVVEATQHKQFLGSRRLGAMRNYISRITDHKAESSKAENINRDFDRELIDLTTSRSVLSDEISRQRTMLDARLPSQKQQDTDSRRQLLSSRQTRRFSDRLLAANETRKRLIEINITRSLRRKQVGQIIKIEKLLVMVKLSDSEYINEVEKCGSNARELERWKEYVVVARNTGEEERPVVLQFYSSRKIPNIEQQIASAKMHSKLDLYLNKSTFKVCFYSTLDKTIALWAPLDKEDDKKKGTVIYLFNSRYRPSALSWLAFFAGVVGVKGDSVIRLRIPDLQVSIEVDINLEDFKSLQRKRLCQNLCRIIS